MDTSVYQFISFLEQFSPEFLSFLTFLVCAVSILGMLRFYGAAGLYVYNAVAIIVANIQVLRLVKFGFSPEPTALGTVVFATTYLVSDILSEHYGVKSAKASLWLSFISQILVTVLMILTLGHLPLVEDLQVNTDYTETAKMFASFDTNYTAMMKLFVPSVRLLFSSLLAYVLSQLFDIWVFQKIRNLTHGKYVWLRQNASTFFSGLLDSFIFSYFAWVLLNPDPISFYTLIVSYVLGTYFLRLIINILGTPIMYLSYKVRKNNNI